MPTYRDYFSEIKKRVKEATPQQVADLLRSGDTSGFGREALKRILPRR